ncbi:MAG TPA: glycosyl hydrolase family 18 protein [Candidatus Binatia bacterium]|nr:glycosyl hydrolase family 18 protein [Candidatus Binatia bacterium]
MSNSRLDPDRRPRSRQERRRDPGARLRHLGFAFPLALVIALSAAPAPTAGSAMLVAPSTDPWTTPPAPEAGTSPAGPSILYEESLAHAGDRITFSPGERVRVPFRPRPGDVWPVGGRPPRSLPAGRASGREMAESRQGAIWADVAGSPPPTADGGTDGGPDAPVTAPSDVVAGEEGAIVGPTADPTADPTAGAGLRREVFGFLPYWQLNSSTLRLRYDLLSTIAYFSVGADRSGNLLKKNSDGTTTTGWAGWTSSKLTSIIDEAHRNGTRVVLTISVFAWSDGEAAKQAALLGDPAARLNLARQAAAAVRDRGADGINLDFEPIVSGYADEFVELVRTIRAELDRIAPGYYLTFDTTGWIGNYPIEAATAPGGADAIFIMGYDYRTGGSSPVGSVAPLAGPTYDIGDTVAAYTARVPASKLILGVPYYGRAWSTDTDQLNATNISGTKYGTSNTVIYTTAADLAVQYGRRYDPREQVAWFAYQRENCTTTYGCVTSWRQVYYDDAQSLGAKYDLVNRAGLRGAGIWALGYDGTRPELYNALALAFLDDRTPPRAGIRPLTATSRDEGIWVEWGAYDETGVASYDVQVSLNGGPWTDWLTGTTASGEVYLAAHGQSVAFRVRARDVKGNVSAWNVTTNAAGQLPLAPGSVGRVVTNNLSIRTGPGTSNLKLGEFRSGDLVAITDGPVSSGGYTWYEVSGPLDGWGPIDPAYQGVWAAAGDGSSSYIVGALAPNVTTVDAGIRGFGFGDPAAGSRFVSPNGDGLDDAIRLTWTNARTFDALTLKVFRSDGSLVDSRSLSGAAGPQTFEWDARVGGAPVPDGTYVLQLVGVAGGVTYSAPSAVPVTPGQLATFGITVDRLPISRLAGTDRYATAAAISAATFPSSGVPVAYVATGLNYPDALAGSVAAARAGGPLLLVTRDTIPAPTAAELARLKPARIVILGSTGVVADGTAAAARSAAL